MAEFTEPRSTAPEPFRSTLKSRALSVARGAEDTPVATSVYDPDQADLIKVQFARPEVVPERRPRRSAILAIAASMLLLVLLVVSQRGDDGREVASAGDAPCDQIVGNGVEVSQLVGQDRREHLERLKAGLDSVIVELARTGNADRKAITELELISATAREATLDFAGGDVAGSDAAVGQLISRLVDLDGTAGVLVVEVDGKLRCG